MPVKLEDYPKEYSRHSEYIMYAVERGYGFDFTQKVITTPSNTEIVPKLYGKQRYPTITINSLGNFNRKLITFAVHKFVGYLIFGEIALRRGVNVRHLDDNRMNLSLENIAVGTSQDNNLDKPAHIRKQMAVHARAQMGKRPPTSYVTEKEVEAILLEYFTKRGHGPKAVPGTVKNIAGRYGYPRSCIQAICNGRSFNDIYERVKHEFYEQHKS